MMHTEHEREFATMMQIMLDQMPDNPLQGIDLVLTIVVGIVEGRAQIRDGPAIQRGLNHLPGRFEPTDQFSRRSDRPIALAPLGECSQALIALLEHIIQPSGAHADQMSSKHTNRTQVWCCPQGQLIWGKRSKRSDQMPLVDFPTGVEGCKYGSMCHHTGVFPRCCCDTTAYAAEPYRRRDMLRDQVGKRGMHLQR